MIFLPDITVTKLFVNRGIETIQRASGCQGALLLNGIACCRPTNPRLLVEERTLAYASSASLGRYGSLISKDHHLKGIHKSLVMNCGLPKTVT
ncbi:MAG TPA: hypothetical protein VGO47_11105 [Chlamydiales bacterium]|nr:hypothetical protein [Chlamydiales bacterium]